MRYRLKKAEKNTPQAGAFFHQDMSSYLLQRYGRSMMVPGSLIVSRVSNAFLRTVICCLSLPGSPSGWPIGHFRKTALGAFVSSVNLLTMDMPAVGMPAFSISLCISPTDRLQRPHPGVSSTQSTPSSLSFFAASGAVSLKSVFRWGPSMCPIKP